MARLHLSIGTEGRSGRIGTDESQGLVVTVTRGSGEPDKRLKPGHFTVQAFLDVVLPVVIVGGQASPADGEGRSMPGVYFLRIALKGFPWEQAIYAIAVSVKRGRDFGVGTATLDLH